MKWTLAAVIKSSILIKTCPWFILTFWLITTEIFLGRLVGIRFYLILGIAEWESLCNSYCVVYLKVNLKCIKTIVGIEINQKILILYYSIKSWSLSVGRTWRWIIMGNFETICFQLGSRDLNSKKVGSMSIFLSVTHLHVRKCWMIASKICTPCKPRFFITLLQDKRLTLFVLHFCNIISWKKNDLIGIINYNI